MSNADDCQTDHTLYEVYQQPIALDRFSMHDVGSNEAAGTKTEMSSLKDMNKFVYQVVHIKIIVNQVKIIKLD